jgi:hypothetical protein
VDVLTREVQEGFKRLDRDIRAMAAAEGGGEDDAQVGVWAGGRLCVLAAAACRERASSAAGSASRIAEAALTLLCRPLLPPPLPLP